MIYSILISWFFFLCRLMIIQTISNYPFSIKEIIFIFIPVGFSLILYHISYNSWLRFAVFVVPVALMLYALFYRKNFNLLLVGALWITGFWFDWVLSRVAWEEIIKQASNISTSNKVINDPILVWMLWWLTFFFVENIIYWLYWTNTNTLIIRSIVTAIIHLVSSGLIWYGLAYREKKSLWYILLWVGLHFIFNYYVSGLEYFMLLWYSLLCFILITYLLQLSSRLYLVKISWS